MSRRHFEINPNPKLAMLWVGFVVVISIALMLIVKPSSLSVNVLDLLPQEHVSRQLDGVLHQFSKANESRIVWAIQNNAPAAKAFYEKLQATGDFQELNGPLTPKDQKAWLDSAQAMRLGMLDEKTIERLDSPKKYTRWVLSQLYSPVGAPSVQELQNDPLLLLRSTQINAKGDLNVKTENDWIVGSDPQGNTWYLIFGFTKPEVSSGTNASKFVNTIDTLTHQIKQQFHLTDTQWAYQGAIFYSAYAAQTAKHDMTFLGSISLLGLIVLLWVAFRSLRPIALCVLSVGIGAILGTFATLVWFGSLHAITMVMCLSLIGISADYTTYYLTRRMVNGATETPLQSLLSLRPSLVHAFLSTCIAYGIMVISPFPGLQQLAVFAVFGLTGAWLTVYLLFPYLVKGFPVRPVPAQVVIGHWVAAFKRPSIVSVGILAAILVVLVAGASKVQINDDLSILQTPPKFLHDNEKRIASILNRDFSQTWFVITGHTQDELLQTSSKLKHELDALQSKGDIQSSITLPILSQAQQKHIQDKLPAVRQAVVQRLQAMGFKLNPDAMNLPSVVSLNDWLASPLGRNFASLVKQTPDHGWALMLPVGGVANEQVNQTLNRLADQYDNVTWVNRRAQFEHAFTQTRQTIAWLLLLATCVISIGLMKKFGIKQGALGTGLILISLGTGIATLGLVGLPLNIFSLFALILVLGIGVDYVVFFMSAMKTPVQILFAMVVALLSTLLSLGILVYSQTQAVSNFGLVLSMGILTAFLLAPITMWGEKHDE